MIPPTKPWAFNGDMCTLRRAIQIHLKPWEIFPLALWSSLFDNWLDLDFSTELYEIFYDLYLTNPWSIYWAFNGSKCASSRSIFWYLTLEENPPENPGSNAFVKLAKPWKFRCITLVCITKELEVPFNELVHLLEALDLYLDVRPCQLSRISLSSRWSSLSF